MKIFKQDTKQINKGEIICTTKENTEQQWKESAVECLDLIYE